MRISSDLAILQLDALTLSARLHNGQLTATKLMEATLQQVEDMNPKVNAIVSMKEKEDLLQRAQKCDEELALKRLETSIDDGYFGSEEYQRHWLLGIPMAVKDMANAEGFSTTMGGSPLVVPTGQDAGDLSNAEVSDPFVQRIVDAGAILIGKTNTPELGLGSHTFNTYFGATRNPLNHDWSAGGSSGGAAAAVASRMLILADGSDMMGSLRNPAAWNAPPLFSLRPTAGIMEEKLPDKESDQDDGNPLDYPISTIGPIAKTVDDMTLLFQTMAPAHSKLTVNIVQDILDIQIEPTENKEENPKVAWMGDWNGKLPMEEGVINHCLDSIETSLVDVLNIELITQGGLFFDMEKLWDSWITIRSSVLYHKMIQEYDWQELMSSSIRRELKWELERGRVIGQKELSTALDIALEWSTFTNEQLYEHYDAIALPSCQLYPFPVEWTFPKEINGRKMDTYHRWMEIMVPISLAGLPCVTIPIGLDPQGRPMGISIAGPRGSDEKLLRIAKACEWALKAKTS